MYTRTCENTITNGCLNSYGISMYINVNVGELHCPMVGGKLKKITGVGCGWLLADGWHDDTPGQPRAPPPLVTGPGELVSNCQSVIALPLQTH